MAITAAPSLAPPMKLVLLSIVVVALGIFRQIDHGRRRAHGIRQRHRRTAMNRVVEGAEIGSHQHSRHDPSLSASRKVTPINSANGIFSDWIFSNGVITPPPVLGGGMKS